MILKLGNLLKRVPPASLRLDVRAGRWAVYSWLLWQFIQEKLKNPRSNRSDVTSVRTEFTMDYGEEVIEEQGMKQRQL